MRVLLRTARRRQDADETVYRQALRDAEVDLLNQLYVGELTHDPVATCDGVVLLEGIDRAAISVAALRDAIEMLFMAKRAVTSETLRSSLESLRSL